MPGAADNGREDRTRCIITSKASFAHTRSIVHNKSSNLLTFTHYYNRTVENTKATKVVTLIANFTLYMLRL